MPQPHSDDPIVDYGRQNRTMIEDILNVASELYDRTGIRPDAVRCHPETAYHLGREQQERAFTPHTYTMPGITDRSIVGIRLETDQHLPPGMWRLCDEHDTLLYDSREGTHAL